MEEGHHGTAECHAEDKAGDHVGREDPARVGGAEQCVERRYAGGARRAPSARTMTSNVTSGLSGRPGRRPGATRDSQRRLLLGVECAEKRHVATVAVTALGCLPGPGVPLHPLRRVPPLLERELGGALRGTLPPGGGRSS